MPIENGLPVITPIMEQKFNRLEDAITHEACKNDDICDNCAGRIALLEIIKTQIRAELLVLPQLRRQIRRQGGLALFLQTWITQNSNVHGAALAAKFLADPENTPLNAAPTLENPNSFITFEGDG